MKLKHIILFFFCIGLGNLSAQTLEQARSMFTKGEYEKAKPTFAKFVKSQPRNANYNYWYGVCCQQTGEVEKSVKYLEFAHSKKILNAPYYLGQAYDELYRFEDAIKCYEEYIDAQAKKKQSTEKARALLEKSKINARMLKGVEEVCFIDSFIVDKKDFLSSYKISRESGSLYAFNEYFQREGDNEGTVYETELGNRIYYSEKGENDTLSIFTKNKLIDEWSKAYPLPESINSSANVNYPFVLTDGITIYYASDGENSMGGYDIFVTRYNTSTNTYLVPENVGMPFNSPSNDYMYVIDEYNELGWFATDRSQPEDKVCIYVFIPNSSKQTYNYESIPAEKIRNLARIHSIEDTWKDEEEVEAARKRLQTVMQERPEQQKKYDFSFVINDLFTYHSISDFKSETARECFLKYQQIEKDYRLQADKLENQRQWYSEANEQEKVQAAPAILDLEKRVFEMWKELDDLAIQARNEENKTLNK